MAYIDALYEKNFLEYASYVIKDRAIPNLEDGAEARRHRLKSVRITSKNNIWRIQSIHGADILFLKTIRSTTTISPWLFHSIATRAEEVGTQGFRLLHGQQKITHLSRSISWTYNNIELKCLQ